MDWLTIVRQQWPPLNVSYNCGAELHNSQKEFSTILLYKTVAFQQYSWLVRWVLLSGGHAKESQSWKLKKVHFSLLKMFCRWFTPLFVSFSCCIISTSVELKLVVKWPLLQLGILFVVFQLSRPWGSKTEPKRSFLCLFPYNSTLFFICPERISKYCITVKQSNINSSGFLTHFILLTLFVSVSRDVSQGFPQVWPSKWICAVILQSSWQDINWQQCWTLVDWWTSSHLEIL